VPGPFFLRDEKLLTEKIICSPSRPALQGAAAKAEDAAVEVSPAFGRADYLGLN